LRKHEALPGELGAGIFGDQLDLDPAGLAGARQVRFAP
jgi:hypothetical protein